MIGSHCETGDVRQKADFVSESNPALSQALKAQEASFCKRMGRGIMVRQILDAVLIVGSG
jgi:hypothetical protein